MQLSVSLADADFDQWPAEVVAGNSRNLQPRQLGDQSTMVIDGPSARFVDEARQSPHVETEIGRGQAFGRNGGTDSCALDGTNLD